MVPYLLPIARAISSSEGLTRATNSEAGGMIVEAFLNRTEEADVSSPIGFLMQTQ